MPGPANLSGTVAGADNAVVSRFLSFFPPIQHTNRRFAQKDGVKTFLNAGKIHFAAKLTLRA